MAGVLAPVAAGAAGRTRRWLGAAGILLGLAAWEGLARTLDPAYLPPPSAVAVRLPGLFVRGPLLGDAAASVSAVLAGTLASCAIGVPLAVLAHACTAVRWLLAPLVELVRGIAPLALLPAFLLLFGLGTGSTIAIIAWVAWPPVFITVLAGLDATDPSLVDAARSMGAGWAWLLASVYLPSLAGHLLAAVRLAAGSAWLAVVAGEMLGSNAGLGFRILEWSQAFRIADMYAAIAVIGACGLAMNGAILALGRMFRHGEA